MDKRSDSSRRRPQLAPATGRYNILHPCDILMLSTMATCIVFSLLISFVHAMNSPTISETMEINGTPNEGNLHANEHQQNTQHSATKRKKTTQKQRRTINGANRNNIAPYDYNSYMHWIEAVLGIKSAVEIQDFEYIDHLRMHWDNSNHFESTNENFKWLTPYIRPIEPRIINTETPTIITRGLSAKHDIQVGDIVISIPLYSLLSIPTTIDHDPVLSRIIGPDARLQYGWNNLLEYEVPLLAVALLYHRSLGKDSPLWRYIELLMGSSTEYLPFLWSEQELKSKASEIGAEVVELARGIRQDVYVMYDLIMGTLVKDHKDLFGPQDGYFGAEPNDKGEEWHFSYENFQWAFAMVISRHHFLPIAEFDEDNVTKQGDSTKQNPSSIMHETSTSVSDLLPPANQPTDSWAEEAVNEERITDEPNMSIGDDIVTAGPTKHSFMAPLADLINFGPPCLTGSYNTEEHTFELIATCAFKTGQEITFYYSSDCSDVMVANYGFLHPLVPTCTTSNDWKYQVEALEEKYMKREDEISDLHNQIDFLREELREMNNQLVECKYEDGERKNPDQKKLRKENPSTRHDVGVRGHSHASDDHNLEDL